MKDCDYIKIVEESTIFAGTILGIKQKNCGYSPDLPDKYFDLTIASNAQLTSKVYVDMQFPAGATVTQVLKGNHVGDAWYNSALGEFYGIIPIRVNVEGITTGTIDDFSSITLSEVAFLWGQTVNDVLDTICKTADAWWEVTPDKVFNMRFNVSHDSAPLVLDSNAKAYDLEPTSDAYTMYSAVRVIGGKGKGNLKWTSQSVTNDPNFKHADINIVDSTTMKLKYPVYNFDDQSEGHQAIVQYDTSAGMQFLAVGFSGIDDNNANYQALTSYGSDEVKLKSGYSFVALPTTTGGNYVNIGYYPLIPIVTRLVDPTLSAEVKAQRGGTGMIEYILKDDTITDFSVASEAGMNFLKENARRTDGIKFKTKVLGFVVGQLLQGNVPYYGVSGEYLIMAVAATIVAGVDGIMWEYEIEASTSAYRDSLKGLFYTMQKTNLKLGDDFPANDGIYLNSKISIQSDLEIRAINPPTWEEIDEQGLTWAEFESQGKTWKELENTLCECDLSGNYLAWYAKLSLTNALNGSAINAGVMCAHSGAKLDIHALGGGGSLASAYPTSGSTRIAGNTIESSYFFDESQATQDKITSFVFEKLGPGYEVQEVPINIDKTAANPYGEYSLSIVKKDTVTGLSSDAESIIVGLLNGNGLDATMLDTSELTVFSDDIYPIATLFPLGTAKITNDSIARNYYLDESYQWYLYYVETGFYGSKISDPYLQRIPISIDKSATNPLGKYSLTIVKKDTVI